MTEGKSLWHREAVCTHWNLGGHNTLGEPTHDSSVEGAWMWGLETGEIGVKEFPTTSSVLVYSLWRANPSPSWGPQAECNGTLPKDMQAGRTRSQTCLLSPMWIFCSLQFAFDFEPVPRPCLHLRPWFLTPDWVIIQVLLWWLQGHPTAPAGVDLRLC